MREEPVHSTDVEQHFDKFRFLAVKTKLRRCALWAGLTALGWAWERHYDARCGERALTALIHKLG